VAALGTRSARFEREPLMNSTLTPLGLESRTWNGVEIQRRPTDGYVNATAMCKANGKLWKNYHQNDRTQAYIAALTKALGSAGNPANPIQTITTGPNHLRGTWVHPRIAVDLARWISPAFAVWMDGWFLEGVTPRIAAEPSPATTLPMVTIERIGTELHVRVRPANEPVGAPAVAQPHDFVADQLWRQRKQLTELHNCLSLRMFWQACSNRDWTELVWQHPTMPLRPSRRSLAAMAAVAAPPRPPRPAPSTPAPAPRPQHHQARPPQPAQQQGGYRPSDLITGPELAHLLGLDAHSINKWAAARSIGAERNGWRLIGRGKLSAGKQCSVYPPGCASWLFQKL
jgi:hypothetical protein